MRNFTKAELSYINRMSKMPKSIRRKMISIAFTKNHDRYQNAAEKYINGDNEAFEELKRCYRRFSVLQSIPL